MLGGTCQSTYIPDSANSCPADVQRSGAEEAATMVRITSRPMHECSPSVSPNGEFVAFESWEEGDFYLKGGDFDIWVTGVDGAGGFQRVTNSPADDFYPVWFPDGSRLLFTSVRGGFPSIWAQSPSGLGGTQKISWTGTYDYTGDVSPDGSFIVFSRGEQFLPSPIQICKHMFYPTAPWLQTDESVWLPRIYRMDINGSRVTDLGAGFDPKISPDGKKIVYSSFKSGTHDIWIMDIDGKSSTQLTTHSGHEISPCWSPNGKWIAYSRGGQIGPESFTDYRTMEYWNIWIANIETGEHFQKTFSQVARDLAPEWAYTKDGGVYRDYIYFHSDRDDFATTGFDIYRINPDMGIEKYDHPDLQSLGANTVVVKFDAAHQTDFLFDPAAKPRIKVLNTTSIEGWAEEVAEDLRSRGFIVVEVGNAKDEKNLPWTKIYYNEGFRRVAGDIALEIMPGKQYIYPKNIKDSDMIISLGGVKPAPAKK